MLASFCCSCCFYCCCSFIFDCQHSFSSCQGIEVAAKMLNKIKNPLPVLPMLAAVLSRCCFVASLNSTLLLLHTGIWHTHTSTHTHTHTERALNRVSVSVWVSPCFEKLLGNIFASQQTRMLPATSLSSTCRACVCVYLCERCALLTWDCVCVCAAATSRRVCWAFLSIFFVRFPQRRRRRRLLLSWARSVHFKSRQRLLANGRD